MNRVTTTRTTPLDGDRLIGLCRPCAAAVRRQLAFVYFHGGRQKRLGRVGAGPADDVLLPVPAGPARITWSSDARDDHA